MHSQCACNLDFYVQKNLVQGCIPQTIHSSMNNCLLSHLCKLETAKNAATDLPLSFLLSLTAALRRTWPERERSRQEEERERKRAREREREKAFSPIKARRPHGPGTLLSSPTSESLPPTGSYSQHLSPSPKSSLSFPIWNTSTKSCCSTLCLHHKVHTPCKS